MGSQRSKTAERRINLKKWKKEKDRNRIWYLLNENIKLFYFLMIYMIVKIKYWHHDVKCGKWKKNTTSGLLLLIHARNPSYSVGRVLITLAFEATPDKEFMRHYLKNTQQTNTQEKNKKEKKKKERK
jgi:hypothetical protein